jgi:hypothetical protein
MHIKFVCTICLACSLFAREASDFSPWFTGTVLSNPGQVVSEPYACEVNPLLYFAANTGQYNSHWTSHTTPTFFSINPQLYYYFALNSWFELVAVEQAFYNSTQGKHSFAVGNFLAGIDFQLYPSTTPSYFPGVLLSVKEIFPTGKFNQLNPDKLQTDLGGNGAFGTSFTLVFYKVYRLAPTHFLSITVSGEYVFQSNVKVKGFNAFGGGYGTVGKIDTGAFFQQMLNLEYSLNQHWNLTFDEVWTHSNKSTFSGQNGTNPIGTPSSESISFAPGFEYSWTKDLGLATTFWFSAFGRNSPQFRTLGFSLVYLF